MRLLALESVGRSGSACIHDGGLVEFAACAGSSEADLAPLASGLLDRHGPVAALALASGPGSFTGLRVAAVAARTIAWLEAVPVIAVDSLAATAAQAGDGLWWVLLPLKRDTTFHALFRVAAGRIETLAPSVAAADAAVPALHPLTAQAVAIGPALTAKPGLAERWCPGIGCGSSAGPDARGVALAAQGGEPRPWAELLPAYLMEPAPVLQRRSGGPTSAI
jgi:tRNA threonylcarbamoyl adenosine modification protein YeaZ